MSSRPKVRVGAVNYLNTKPLIYQLEQLAPQAEIELDLPSRLADRLAKGTLDVALIPVIECFSQPDYTIVSDACIGCRGPVLSVKLFSRVPLPEIQSLALDEGSRTSVALVRILLKKQFGIEPRLEPLPIGRSLDETRADAVLLIGDRAIHSPPGDYVAVWDLGDQWCRWAELPFVFALWAARSDVDLLGVDTALNDARDLGVKNLETIAATESAQLGLTVPECITYLRDNLHFYLGPPEQQAIALFARLAGEMGFTPEGAELGLPHCKSARQSDWGRAAHA